MAEALELSRRAGDRRLAAFARAELADAALTAGDIDDALEQGRAAVQAWCDLDQPGSEGYALLVLCEASLSAKDIAGACEAAEQALRLLELGGIPGVMGETFGLLAASTGRCETAALLLGHADALCAANESPRDPGRQRVVAQAAEVIEAAIGVAEAARLRAAGAKLSDAEVSSLARTLLAGLRDGATAATGQSQRYAAFASSSNA